MDIFLGICLFRLADTDILNKNGDAFDLVLVLLFAIVCLVFPIFSLVFLFKKHDVFYSAYIRDKT